LIKIKKNNKKIKKIQPNEFIHLNQTEYGRTNPIYSIGRWAGAVLFSFVFNSINRKYIMAFAGITHG